MLAAAPSDQFSTLPPRGPHSSFSCPLTPQHDPRSLNRLGRQTAAPDTVKRWKPFNIGLDLGLGSCALAFDRWLNCGGAFERKPGTKAPTALACRPAPAFVPIQHRLVLATAAGRVITESREQKTTDDP